MRYALRVEQAGELIAPRPGLVYTAARRFPRPSERPPDVTRSPRLVPGDELALLDAVDVWCAVRRRAAAKTSKPTMGPKAITTIAGSVLRDAPLIDALKTQGEIPKDIRQALTIVSELLRGRLL